ncbi:unknown [Firmicutes bacterium CAG:582]|nr:unknown [Firmicutes bacterium CAG:582]
MKKNKKNNNEEKMENFLDVLIRNYKTVPGVKIVLKLALYFIFIIIFVIVISISNYSKKDNNNTLTTTTTETISKNYYDIINNLSLLKKEIVIIGDIKLNLDIDETISGYEEQSSEIKKVIIKDNKIYEINNGIETLSNLMDDASYLNPTELIKYLLNNKSIKTTENNNNIYKYNDLTVYVENEKITKVVFNNGYEINYN